MNLQHATRSELEQELKRRLQATQLDRCANCGNELEIHRCDYSGHEQDYQPLDDTDYQPRLEREKYPIPQPTRELRLQVKLYCVTILLLSLTFIACGALSLTLESGSEDRVFAGMVATVAETIAVILTLLMMLKLRGIVPSEKEQPSSPAGAVEPRTRQAPSPSPSRPLITPL